jgi:hypothetical protein
MLNAMPVNTPKSEHRLHVLWPFLLIDSQICWHILYLHKFSFFKEKPLRSIYNSSWTLLSVMWGKLWKLLGRFGLPLRDTDCVKIIYSYKQRKMSAAMNFRYSNFFQQKLSFYVAAFCILYTHGKFRCHPKRNERVAPWPGVISQKKWNGHSVTRCHVSEETKRPLRNAVSYPRSNETVTPWRGAICEKKLNGHSVTRCHTRRIETTTPWPGVISQKKLNRHSVTWCHIREEIKWSLRDAVSSQNKWNGNFLTRCHIPEEIKPWPSPNFCSVRKQSIVTVEPYVAISWPEIYDCLTSRTNLFILFGIPYQHRY